MGDYMFMLESHLSAGQYRVVGQMRELASEAGLQVFLTGGAMRDTLGGFPVRDLDFTVEGNALKLAKLVVASLNLEIAAGDIEPEAPLYREGLGLDSIDILEVALAISKTYGIHLRSDDQNNTQVFQSLRSLSEHVQRQRQHN